MISGRGVLAAGCVLALLLAGCAKGVNSSAAAATPGPSSLAPDASGPIAATGASTGDPDHGKQIFTDNCSQCHGATGREGGIGPSLHDEKKRKTYAQTIVWIENPVAPMPKLYPSPLGKKDVEDVASFVQTL